MIGSREKQKRQRRRFSKAGSKPQAPAKEAEKEIYVRIVYYSVISTNGLFISLYLSPDLDLTHLVKNSARPKGSNFLQIVVAAVVHLPFAYNTS